MKIERFFLWKIKYDKILFYISFILEINAFCDFVPYYGCKNGGSDLYYFALALPAFFGCCVVGLSF